MIDKCDKCGKRIRFIRRAGLKALKVNSDSSFFIPDDNGGEVFITTKGETRRGFKAQDGIKGFKLHECFKEMGFYGKNRA